MEKSKVILVAKNVDEILYQMKSVSGMRILAGCTQERNIGEKSISIRSIESLKSIEKRERYIDVGAAVTISELLSTCQNKLPCILHDALCTIGTEFVRNLATVAGNICSKNFMHTLYAPLLALNARLEIKSPEETRSVQMSQFEGLGENSILTKIRIPLDEWDVEIFRRVGPANRISPLSASFVFLVNTQRNMITNIKIIFAGKTLFYSKEYENKLIGMKLPLTGKTIDGLIEEADAEYMNDKSKRNAEPILRFQFLNLLRNSLEQMS